MSYYSKKFDEKIVKLLKDGSVGFMPSDTIYGLSGLALNENTVSRIRKLKERDGSKPFIVLISDIDQAQTLGLAKKDLKIMEQFWPAPITFICPASWETPQYLHKGLETVAVRVPDHERLRRLIAKTGPIVSTSANLQGQPTAKNTDEAIAVFGEKLDFFVDDGRLDERASTIVRADGDDFVILRQGSYQFNSLKVGKKTIKTL